jgi:nucleoside-diphosphate-sugar epimerase
MSAKQPILVLVTGTYGFLGMNLVIRLGEQANTEVVSFSVRKPSN